MGDGIGQFNEAPLIEEKHEPSMRLPSPPTASSASQVLLAAGRAFAGVSCTYECWINREVADLKLVGWQRIAVHQRPQAWTARTHHADKRRARRATRCTTDKTTRADYNISCEANGSCEQRYARRLASPSV